MNKYFRYLVSINSYKTAAVFDSVKSSLEQKGFKDKQMVKYSGKIVISSGFPNVSITVPDNPIIGGTKTADGRYENGKYNVFIQIKSGANPTKAGINTIIVEANTNAAGGLSGGYDQNFGDTTWISSVLSRIQQSMSKYFGNVSLNKLGLGNFSAGYSIVGKALNDPKINKYITDVVSLDGMHYGGKNKVDPNGMKPWMEFAKKAKSDPNKKLTIIHSAIDPGKYASTTQTSQYILDNLGVQRQKYNGDKSFSGKRPETIANKGGVSVVQLYDKQDPYMINGKANVPGTSGYQHIQIAKALPEIWQNYLKDWNE